MANRQYRKVLTQFMDLPYLFKYGLFLDIKGLVQPPRNIQKNRGWVIRFTHPFCKNKYMSKEVLFLRPILEHFS